MRKTWERRCANRRKTGKLWKKSHSSRALMNFSLPLRGIVASIPNLEVVPSADGSSELPLAPEMMR